jgi:hypothetical protein
MNEKACIIWTENGCWFQQRINGISRSSYLGHIGTPEEVKDWCALRTVDFATQFHAFNGTPVKDKMPKDLRST